MDIITHVMIGAAASSPFWASHPLESVMFTFGSILPDIDALSRQFGKVAFLRFHQGWTHALPLIAAITGACVALLVALDLSILVPSILLCGLGAVLHVFLDWTNTFGVRLFAPFDRQRRCAEWVFFIDVPFIVATIGVLLAQLTLSASGATSPLLGGTWAAAALLYFAWRGALRRRAARLAPAAVSLIPSPLVPWRFEGLELSGDRARTYVVDVRRPSLDDIRDVLLPEAALQGVPEYDAMRELSRGFVAVESTGDRIECRDLRTRFTFGTNFGRLVLRAGVVERFDV